MAVQFTAPKPPKPVADAFAACPAPLRERALKLRDLIFGAAADADTGPLTETLKWGEPSYAPKKPRTGTAVRIGWDEEGGALSLFVHCQTKVAEDWRAQYEDTLQIIGNRELRLSAKGRLPRAALKHCIAMALTYHQRRR